MESAPSVLYGLLCFSAIILWTLVAILTLPLWFLFRIFKWFQGVIISYYKLGRVLASNDVPFLHETENNRNFINGLFVVDGEVDLDELRQLIMARVVQNSEEPSYARMRKLVVKHYWRYVWQDETEFDIKKHVFPYDGESPRNEEELQKMLSKHFSSPMRDGISPWEVIVASLNMPGKDQTAICMRIHHAIGDGFALIGLFARLMDKKPELLRVKKPVVTPCDKQKQVSVTRPAGPCTDTRETCWSPVDAFAARHTSLPIHALLQLQQKRFCNECLKKQCFHICLAITKNGNLAMQETELDSKEKDSQRVVGKRAFLP